MTTLNSRRLVLSREQVEQILNDGANCGTGAGGFKLGNKCAKGGSSPGGSNAWDDSKFPDSIEGLTLVNANIGGSTGAKLYVDADGKKWVAKKGKNEGHLRNEQLANEVYHAAGVLVPKSKIYESPDGPTKLHEFIDGTPLKDLSASDQAKHLPDIRKGFAVDVALANWDVVGLSKDNIVIGTDGKAYRIDVGGSLEYRAAGKLKGDAFGTEATEFDTMRTGGMNPSAVEVFGKMTVEQIDASAKELAKKTPAILKVLDGKPALYNKVSARIESTLDKSAEHWDKVKNAGKYEAEAKVKAAAAQKIKDETYAQEKLKTAKADTLWENSTIAIPAAEAAKLLGGGKVHAEQATAPLAETPKFVPKGMSKYEITVKQLSEHNPKAIAEAVAKAKLKAESKGKPAIGNTLETGQGLTNYVKSYITGAKFKEGQYEKMAYLNPEGLQNNTFYMPMMGGAAKYPANAENVAALSKILPPGTEIKGVWVMGKSMKGEGEESLTKGGAIGGKGKKKAVQQQVDPTAVKSLMVPEQTQSPYPGRFKITSVAKHQPPDLPDNIKEYSKKLTYAEKAAISSWKGSASGIRKAIAIDPPPPPKGSGSSAKEAAAFYTGIMKAPRCEGTFYRGIHSEWSIKQFDMMTQAGEGGIWADTSPMGMSRTKQTPIEGFTGYNSKKVDGVILTVHAKTARPIEHISSHGAEREIIGVPGAKYKIVKLSPAKAGDGKPHEVELEEIYED